MLCIKKEMCKESQLIKTMSASVLLKISRDLWHTPVPRFPECKDARTLQAQTTWQSNIPCVFKLCLLEDVTTGRHQMSTQIHAPWKCRIVCIKTLGWVASRAVYLTTQTHTHTNRHTHQLKTYDNVTDDFCKLFNLIYPLLPSSSPLSLFLRALVVSLGKLITHPVWFLHSVFWEWFRAPSSPFKCTKRPHILAFRYTFAAGFCWACCKLSIWRNSGLCRTVFSRDSFSWVGASPLSFNLACSLSTAAKAHWVSAKKL